jgi:hypothetical protein
MNSGNGLDQLIQRFQHRWETDRQWRAAMGVALTLVSLVVLCSCVTVTALLGQNVLAGLGFVASPNQANSSTTPDTGARLVNGVLQFPTPTSSWVVGTVPAVSPIPNSQTPQPSPTPSGTPTPTQTDTPSPTQCNGNGNCGNPTPTGGNVTIQVTGWNPATWANGKHVSISVHTSVPNDGFGFIFNFPNGSTWLSANDNPNLQTDGAGNGTYSTTIQNGYCTPGLIDVKVQVQQGNSLGYGQDAHIPCA